MALDFPNAPTVGQVFNTADRDWIWTGSRWDAYGAATPTFPVAATVAAANTSTSAVFAALATAGPAVTMTTGTSVLVTVSTLVNNDGLNNTSFMGVAVSGATTIAASDARSARHVEGSIANSDSTAFQFVLTGLTPGINTFTAQYRRNGGTSTFTDRTLSVVRLD